MSTEPRKPPSTDTRRRRRRQKGGTLGPVFWTGLLLVAMAAGWFLWQLGQDVEVPLAVDAVVDDEATADVAAGDRAIVLVFPEWDAAGYVTERRRIPSRGRPEEDLHALLAELCRGPQRSGAISAVPTGTEVLAVFLDATGRHAVVDLSTELVVQHPGGSAAELATLTSILRTVALNFPALESCRLVVDGAELETLGGHLALDEAFELRRWL